MQIKSFNFQFIPKIGIFIAVSILAVAASIFLITTKGLNFGTDFKGGVKLQYRFTQAVSDGDLRNLIEPLNIGDFTVQKVGQTDENRFVVKLEQQEKPEEAVAQISKAFSSGLSGAVPTIEQQETVGPKAGADLRKKAQLAIIVSWLLMLVYIGYRFDFSFAPGAIIALIHDVIITLGAFALTGREVTLTIVAALLTIVGYSVNDTIVIYDRIRENQLKHESMGLREVINLSINETLSRTVITNFTVFMVVVLMFLFGEGEFQGFGFAMIVGAIAGTYSTIYVASPCYIFLKEYQAKRLKGEAKKAA